jgi:hypothetical protein
MEIRKGIYALKQASLIANAQLTALLAKYGYYPAPRTLSLWRHYNPNINFCLMVNDFGIKYISKHNADHLVQALQDLYTISMDWKGELY